MGDEDRGVSSIANLGEQLASASAFHIHRRVFCLATCCSAGGWVLAIGGQQGHREVEDFVSIWSVTERSQLVDATRVMGHPPFIHGSFTESGERLLLACKDGRLVFFKSRVEQQMRFQRRWPVLRLLLLLQRGRAN